MRSCQRQTQVFDLAVASMIAAASGPSSPNQMIFARQTCFCGELPAEMIAFSRTRSAEETSNVIPERMQDRRICRQMGILFVSINPIASRRLLIAP
ncbi:hypothetical protein AOG23_33510 [Rhizobium acidisoli]|nr:hypothetical protein AOG23_33510 [Rhizobium acidisoli]